MSRGGWYRSPDGQSVVHLLFGSGKQAPSQCAAPAMPGDSTILFAGRCGRIGGHLCDATVGETIGGKPITCDAGMCEQHRTSIVGRDIDYCPKHAHLAYAEPAAAAPPLTEPRP